MKNMEFITYEQFGAVGDGVTDDFAAIRKAHIYANENKLPVKADGSKTYYICDTRIDGNAESAVIKTDVDWNGAHFIIDDIDVGYFDGTGRATKDIFHVASDYEMQVINDPEILSGLSGIGEGTKKIDLALGYPALICIYDGTSRVYRRTGEGKKNESGIEKFEILLIDKDGNIDDSTPFMFDYERVTKVEVVRTDIKPITISNGIFTTKASRVNALADGRRASYFKRGILINRSYTTLVGVEHYIEGEITTFEHRDLDLRGPCYDGFLVPNFAQQVILEKCVFTGRRYYRLMGTYDFRAYKVNVVRLIDCKQSNFEIENEEGNTVYSMEYSPITGTKYCWGIGGTNNCKNMEYIRCRLSRFDAHQGLYNGKIIDSEINAMELIGKGEMLIENTKWLGAYPNSKFLCLRPDYGSTWDGTIKVKNSTLYPKNGNLYLVSHRFVNWDYGYRCYFPNIEIENIEVKGLSEGAKVCFLTEDGSAGKEPHMHLSKTLVVPKKTDDDTVDMNNYNPIVPPKYVKITFADDTKVHMTKMPFFENTDFSECDPDVIVIDEKI